MSKYIKKETKGQILFIVLIILAIAAGLIWNAAEEENDRKKLLETAYPMVNANISWDQTYYGGTFE